MQTVQSNKMVRLQKVAVFFDSRPISNPPTGLADQMTALTNALSATQNAAKTQADATDYLARQTKTVRQLRLTLRDEQLLPLYHSAVALSKEVPGILDHFKIPGITLREATYVTQLDVIATRAAEFQADFIAHGAAADFVTTLNNAITQYVSNVSERQQAMQTRSAAREALKTSLDAGSNALRHLNAIVHRVYATDPASMAAWEQAMHVNRAASVSRKTGQTTTGAGGGTSSIQASSATAVQPSSTTAAQSADNATVQSASTTAPHSTTEGA